MKLIAEIGARITNGVLEHRTVPIDYDRYQDNGPTQAYSNDAVLT